MRWIEHSAPAASCLSALGSVRTMASKMAVGECAPPPALVERARAARSPQAPVGKVHGQGSWDDCAVRQSLETTLGDLAPALRSAFEWYQCRGAFFHNDAHYDDRLFGVWCVVGPPADLVFPRTGVRLAAGPGSLVIFDPFEVHGVLAPGADTYSADDYLQTEDSVFIGFEVELTAAVSRAFGITATVAGRVISTRTRVVAATGALYDD